MPTPGVYLVQVGSKIYVGQSGWLEQREKTHRRALENGYHNHNELQGEYIKTNGDFKFHVLFVEKSKLVRLRLERHVMLVSMLAKETTLVNKPGTSRPH